MIFVDRGKVIPAVLSGARRAGPLETLKAITFYKIRKNRRKSFPFKVYSHDEVKQALTRLFHGKCAYCESRYAATQPVDVEHWRPKGRVNDDKGGLILGYYWLAADWTNLLPSCIDCNRERRQLIQPKAEVRLQGKGEWFPIRRGTARARKPGEETREQPLLLNPTEAADDCEGEFVFGDNGVISPRRRRQAAKRARTSIDVYGLNRVALVQERREVIALIKQRIYSITALIRLLRRRSIDAASKLIIQDLLSHEMAALLRFKDPKCTFALMARQLIDEFENKLKSGRV